ncbi:hypothetical protein HDU76_002410 [Blyttiomyces sp. JEL0837]|nr:hypothetical protein HDU76_002410 [Blyttiomyces sp. JEL0837]
MNTLTTTLLLAASVAITGVTAQQTYNVEAVSFKFNNVPAQAMVGDTLKFDLKGGAHNAVSAQDGTCTPITGGINALTDGDTYTFTKAGTYYFICTIGNGYHCQQGMKASITVVDAPASSASSMMMTTDMMSTTTDVMMSSTTSTKATVAPTSVASSASSSSPVASPTTTAGKSGAGKVVVGASAMIAAGVAAFFAL